MCWTGLFKWRPFIRQTCQPMQVQHELLRRIIQSQADTNFGRDHGFANITGYADYVASVPVCSYESLRPYIEAQLQGDKSALNTDPPVMYAQTSGTTAKPKYVPITQHTIKTYHDSQQLVAYAIYREFPAAYGGRILAIASAAEEGKMSSGIPYGSMSGLIYKSMPTLMRRKYVLPAEVFEIEDFQQKYYQIALQALAQADISMIATANPSTLLKLAEVINESIDFLLDDLSHLNPRRALEVRCIYEVKEQIRFEDLWPELKVVVTWVGGNCSVLIPALRKLISTATRVIELGYLSSEFRGGVTFDTRNNLQIPCIHECFFEFAEQAYWEEGGTELLTLDKIEQGMRYYIFATTQSGLYRYDINDIIEVTGYFNKTPTFQFVQKGKGVINLTGEKLCESQLVEVLNQQKSIRTMTLNFFMMLGDASALEYVLYLEHEPLDAFAIEDQLGELNIEYRDKRKSGRLKPLRIEYLREGTGEAYKQFCLDSGQREGQFKLMYLQSKDDCHFNFDEYLR
jgi:hypothetical protein